MRTLVARAHEWEMAHRRGPGRLASMLWPLYPSAVAGAKPATCVTEAAAPLPGLIRAEPSLRAGSIAPKACVFLLHVVQPRSQ